MARTDPTDLAACLALAQRQVGDASGWSQADWEAQLAEASVERGDPPQTHYRPYRTALAYAQRPQPTTLQEGDVSEQYSVTLTQELKKHLGYMDREWEAEVLPPKPSEVKEDWNSDITWGGW